VKRRKKKAKFFLGGEKRRENHQKKGESHERKRGKKRDAAFQELYSPKEKKSLLTLERRTPVHSHAEKRGPE